MQVPTKSKWIKGSLILLTLAGTGFLVYRVIRKRKNRGGKKESARKKLVGLPVNYGTEGYVNVRKTPKVDDENWNKMDFTNNLLGKVKTNPIGVILQETKGADGYYWYKIRLKEPLKNQMEGYVREDAVVIQKK